MKHRFVICIKNEGYEVSLETRKLYEVLDDAEAESHGQFRVIDESQDDYLYPKEFFLPLQLSEATAEIVAASSTD